MTDDDAGPDRFTDCQASLKLLPRLPLHRGGEAEWMARQIFSGVAGISMLAMRRGLSASKDGVDDGERQPDRADLGTPHGSEGIPGEGVGHITTA
ncbi:hypothetical protein [Belnapia mucosa]|uniref:hypothetical protein n=1 Tax=Belnapia mucosa TaxID=2804532 RepID=UPI001F3F93A1|nr:hypothetical protein [Belnapia mucosa]